MTDPITRSCAASLVVVAILAHACSSERSLRPIPVRYNAYISHAIPYGVAIDVLDTETDTIAGSIPDAGSPTVFRITTSRDGQYLAALGPRRITLHDLWSYTISASAPLEPFVDGLAFTPTSDQLLTFALDSTVVHNLPSLTIDTVLSVRLRFCLPSKEGHFVAITRSAGYPADDIRDGIATISPGSWSIEDTMQFQSPATGGGVRTWGAVVSPDRRTAYLLATDGEGNALLALDLTLRAWRFRTSLTTSVGTLQLTPDGSEVWVTQSFSPVFRPYPKSLGYILVLDANSGAPLDTIRTLGLNELYPDSPLPVSVIAMHPTAGKVYVTCPLSIPGLLIIDAASRTIRGSLYRPGASIIYDVSIAPNP